MLCCFGGRAKLEIEMKKEANCLLILAVEDKIARGSRAPCLAVEEEKNRGGDSLSSC